MSHPSDLLWSRHLADELGFWERRALRRHLATCEGCRRLEAELAAERLTFVAAPERAAEVERLTRRLPAARPAPWRWQWLPLALAGAVAVVMLLRLPSGETFSAKGGSVFQLHVRRGDREAPLGKQCHAGDALRGHYRSSRPYLLVLEVGPSGAAEPVFPFGGEASQQIEPGDQLTPGSWILDPVPGRECFQAFFSDHPLSVTDARASLQGPLPGVATASECCDKVAP